MSAVDEMMAPDAEIHMPTGEVVDPAELEGFAAAYRGSFPDWHSAVEDLIAEGDRVAERWTGRGTHRGELQGIPPTGNRVEITGMTLDRLSGGNVVESWTNDDMMGLMRQIGAIPAPEHTEA